MKCDEVQPLQGPYMDSELDARTCFEIQQHLKCCGECSRVFAEVQAFEHRLKTGLNRKPTLSFSWEKAEEAVRTARLTVRQNEVSRACTARHKIGITSVWDKSCAVWNRSPWAWTTLAAAWVVILCLNTAAKESSAPVLARQRAPSTSELRFALKQKERLMADLTVFSTDQTVPNKTKASSPGPRSERRRNSLNT